MHKCATLLIFTLVMVIGSAQPQAQTNTPGSLVQADPPLYPLAAKAAGIEGKIVLKGIIDTDGHVKNLQVVKGPPELRQAALDAVTRWTYHPYTKDGKVVPTPTIATVTFKLGDKKQKVKAMAEAQAALAKTSESVSDPNTSSAAPRNQ